MLINLFFMVVGFLIFVTIATGVFVAIESSIYNIDSPWIALFAAFVGMAVCVAIVVFGMGGVTYLLTGKWL